MNVLVLDMDPQGNASTALGIRHPSGTASIYDVIEGRKSVSDVVQVCPDFDTLDVVPSTIDLSGAELEIATLDNRTELLKEALDTYLKQSARHYDYIFIDCAPSLGLLVLNSLRTAHEVLIPIQAEYYALEGLGQLLKTIQLVQSSFNPDLDISMMLVTMYDRRTMLSKEVYEEVERHYPQVLLKATIPRAVRISEAPSFAQSIIAYDPKSAGAIAYREAALEIARRGAPVHDK
jgi:chromosome partitioning protein